MCIIPSLLYYLSYFKWHAGWRETTIRRHNALDVLSHSSYGQEPCILEALHRVWSSSFVSSLSLLRLVSSRFVAYTQRALSGISFTEMIDERVFGLWAYTNRGEGKTRKKTQKKINRSKYDGSGRKLFLTFNFLSGRLSSVDVHGHLGDDMSMASSCRHLKTMSFFE